MIDGRITVYMADSERLNYLTRLVNELKSSNFICKLAIVGLLVEIFALRRKIAKLEDSIEKDA